jgi:integrase
MRRDNDGLHKRRGVWHFRLKISGRWREVSARTRNYRDAQTTRRKALEAQDEGRLPTDQAKWPFEKAAGVWRENRTRQVSRSTYTTEGHLLKPLLKVFSGRRLGDIASADVQAYQMMRSTEVGPRTVNLEVKILRMILRGAKLWARLADDYKPLREDKRGPGRALSPEQERHLFEVAASNPHWDAAYYAGLLAGNTTARNAELKGLRLVDVDLLERIMTVRRQTTKTDAGCRVVPLNETATWALAKLLERARLLGATEPQHYLFPAFRYRYTKEGTKAAGKGHDPTLPMRTWRTAWRSLTAKAGLPGLRFHDLRHHCVTKLAEAGAPEETIMAIAGHVDRKMLDHYSHIRLEARRKAVALLDPKPNNPTPGEQTEEQPTGSRIN